MAGDSVSTKDFEDAPIGTHLGRCIKLIDIGTQHGSYEGRPTVNDQFIAFFELPNAKMQDGRPFVVTIFYNKVFGKKAKLRLHVEAWRGKPFTDEEAKAFKIMSMLSRTCLLSVVAKGPGKDGVKIGSIMAVPTVMAVPPQVNPSFFFWINEWDQEKFDSLSDGTKELIMKSDEYVAMHNQKDSSASHQAKSEVEVPF